ncbi:rod shape-determining protein RodA [candidate division KSB1 bacterium]|nr:rod shape-determining protein RodA [candidate division KSB1 bacterium]NIR72158.1 rod shape-determining protein RodA [candidate division KSB1 bacterium]NIS26623.1 rod shape-determining protein RodA [candidate division KSB1 bacterium]NIT73391.1 rod shape-determining protein RodA [candidate division KSB1 bacterium]NIU27239.1 rod shape-determining protein RodA [candidate division KSB1 bacterium]
MFYENNLMRHLDKGILLSVFVITVCGLFAIYSATHGSEAQIGHVTFKKQLIWTAIGIVALAATIMTPIRFFHKYAFGIYGFSMVLLILVLLVGTGSGAKRWISFGSVWIQPAEFAKIGTVLALAKYLSHDNRNLEDAREIIVAFGLVLLPVVLIIRQPDLGSGLVFWALVLPVLHWGGLSPIIMFILVAPLVSLICAFNYYSFLIAMIVISLVLILSRRGMVFFLTNVILNIGVGIATPFMWNLLKQYQKKRILTFLGLNTDPQGLGYQVIQSKVAIGSGGFLGKGFLQGTQTHLRFLPEQHTDFIFCVIGEEFGFIGVMVILALFLYLILKSLNIAVSVKSKFLSLLVFGGLLILLFQITVNIGMTVKIMPVTGLPLPFLSYGGSSLLSSLIISGLILNASRRRFEYI